MKHCFTLGINPYYQSIQEITEVLQDSLKPQIQSPVEKVYFYGAGCGTIKNQGKVSEVLNLAFQNAITINVKEDLMAAMQADKRGI